MTIHSSSLSLALLFAPLALASASASFPPLERHLRHRELAARLPRITLDDRQASTSSVPLGGFQEVGDSGVSAQMMFLGSAETVYILDSMSLIPRSPKPLTTRTETENNSLTVTTPDGTTHPAWGTTYNLASNVATPMSVTSNTFCAGGFSLANGSWAVFGGNQPVTYQGVAVNDKFNNPSGANPYDTADGGEAIRMITPCDDGNCQWQEGGAALTMTVGR